MKRKTHRIKGKGFLEDANKFLKNTKILSTVTQAGLPFIAGALGSLGGPLGTAGGIAAGTAIGTAVSNGLKNYGYGKRRIKGGAVYERGIIPIHKMVGTGVRGHKGYGSSVYNNASSSFGRVKF